ncbi:hypothetical protein RD792_016132 [Penstemon davidsonii]|uniref:Inositol-tetrakisphosphate 1-kinase n=1 Tax=Penstemon davidsonii TaxID=160366 RepID=A0ABR0CJ24_9LAMI|nr:hypothetical protein RD792_016132 [Penstemon davidsonii]
MVLSGVVAHSCEDDEKEAVEECGNSPPPPVRVVVGYSLTSKKKKSFLKPNFIRLARSKGIQFVSIDLKKPLSEQGPFDIVLHKSAGKEGSQVIENTKIGNLGVYIFVAWNELSVQLRKIISEIPQYLSLSQVLYIFLLKDYQRAHPELMVLDPPEAIQHVHNRQSMLENVADMKLPDCYGKVCTPRQLVILKDPTSIPDEVTKAGLRVPLVVKPLVVDGTAKSHELFLAYDQFSLSELEPPMVLQEFVNHGGVLFKVYVVGESITVVRRFSLPDVTKCDSSQRLGVFPFPRVSCAAASAENVDLDPSIAGEFESLYGSNILPLVSVELPPRPLLEGLARELRHRLGLQLFNIDMIRQKGTKDLFYVIDINYFPG